MSFGKIDEILASYNFCVEDDIDKNVSLFLSEMQAGIEKNGSSSLAMSKTHLSPLSNCNIVSRLCNEKIIVVDLGGSNLRSGVVCFDEYGKIDILKQEICKTFTKKHYTTSSYFFSELAKNIEYSKNESSYIAFCFSYAINFFNPFDAIVTSLSKDLSVEDIKGRNVGVELKSALLNDGWNENIKIFVLNDTVATLYSSLYKKNKQYSSYVSYILGTGLNAAYIERNNAKEYGEVLILEAGAFNKLKKSEFDKEVIKCSKEGEYHILEKMCSSHYLGRLALNMLDVLILNKVFSQDVTVPFIENSKKGGFNIWEQFNDFLFQSEEKTGFINDAKDQSHKENDEKLRYVLNLIIERTANISTSLIAACCIKNAQYNGENCPIAIAIEGGTVLGTYRLYQKIEQKLNLYLREGQKLYFELKTIENATFIGSAISSLLHALALGL